MQPAPVSDPALEDSTLVDILRWRAARQPDRFKRPPRPRNRVRQFKKFCEENEVLFSGELVVDKCVVSDHPNTVFYLTGREWSSAGGE